MGLFEEEVIKEYDNTEEFLKDYPECKDKPCFLDTVYHNEVTRFINLSFNRKIIIEYKLKYATDLSNYITFKNIEHIDECINFNIKIIKMEQGYSKIKSAKYKNELKILKEKYNIED